jgi:Ulp1 family protease
MSFLNNDGHMSASAETVIPALRKLSETVPISTIKTLENMIAQGACIPSIISNENLKRLTETAWLSDDIMNHYLRLLSERCGGQVFESLLFADRKDRTQQKKMLQLTDVLVALNDGENHWILVRVDCEKEILEVQDSIQKSTKHYNKAPGIKRLRKYLSYYGKNAEAWTLKVLPSEQQLDGDSCGIFTLMNAKALRFGVATPPLNGNVMGFRAKILLELMLGKILEMSY